MRPVWVIVLVGLLSGIGVDGARAEIGPIQVVTETSAFDGTDFKQLEAECPPGTIAFSGGVGLSAATNEGQNVIVHQSQPQGDPPGSWLGLAQEQTPTTSNWGITVYALCATVDGYELVDVSTPFDSVQNKFIQADCPQGKGPIGGGGGIFLFSPDHRLHVLTPTATGWEARGFSSNPAASWILNAKVSCAPAVPIERIEGFTQNQSVDLRDHLGLYCPGDRLALGGGVFIGPSGIGIYTTRPILGGAQGIEGWEVAARNVTGGVAWPMSAAVLCRVSTIFIDSFESGDTSAWSGTVP
ncbi:MAG: hypothetical protein ACRDKW_17375 [Actinomycetota bacterium]